MSKNEYGRTNERPFRLVDSSELRVGGIASVRTGRSGVVEVGEEEAGRLDEEEAGRLDEEEVGVKTRPGARKELPRGCMSIGPR